MNPSLGLRLINLRIVEYQSITGQRKHEAFIDNTMFRDLVPNGVFFWKKSGSNL